MIGGILSTQFVISSAASWAIGAVCTAVLIRGVKIGRRYRFKLAFGTSVKAADQIALVMSAIYASPKDDGEIRLRKIPRNQPERFIEKADKFRLAVDGDLACALEVNALIASHISGRARIVYDDEDYSALGCSQIIVGAPISNLVAENYLERLRTSGAAMCFDIISPSARAEDQLIKDNASGDQYGITDQVEHAIIQRIPAFDGKPGERFYFIIAGLTKFGTEAAGRYLRQNWAEFVRVRHTEKCHGLLLEVGRRNAGSVRLLLSRVA